MATQTCLRITCSKGTSSRAVAQAWLRPHLVAVPYSACVPAFEVRRKYSSDVCGSETKTIQYATRSPEEDGTLDVRLPRSVQVAYLRPLKRQAQFGFPSCDLQMRSYSVRNLEFYVDFALRAAYYLGLPAYGPVPLPRIVERWTVPRSSFIYKKSQENFERKTLRRLIQIKDGHPETIQVWLAFLRKHAYYGIGMKANIWEFSKLGVGEKMDAEVEKLEKIIGPKLERLGLKEGAQEAARATELLDGEVFRVEIGGNAPMTKATM